MQESAASTTTTRYEGEISLREEVQRENPGYNEVMSYELSADEVSIGVRVSLLPRSGVVLGQFVLFLASRVDARFSFSAGVTKQASPEPCENAPSPFLYIC